MLKDKTVEISRNITNGVFGNINPKFMKRDKWTSNEIKVFLTLIYKLQQNKSLNLKLAPKDFSKNLTNSNNFEYFNKILTGIKKKNFFMKLDNEKWRDYSLFSYLEYNNAGDDIIVQFNKDLKDQLFNLKSFSKLDIENTLKLDSYFSLRTRLLLKSFSNKTQFILDIERFKILFQIPESYKNNKIESKVFDVIKKECNEIIDVRFKKNGRTATHVIFNYDYNKIKNSTFIESQNNQISLIPLEIETTIEKCKKNKYVSQAWTKSTIIEINNIYNKYGDIITKQVLIIVYQNLNQPIKVTLVSYIKKVLKNILETEELKNPKTKNVTPIKELKNEIKIQEIEINDITEEEEETARTFYLEQTGTKKFDALHEKIFETLKKGYIKQIREIK